MRVANLLVAVLLPVAASALSFEKYASQVLGTITYIDYAQSPGFGLWAQLAGGALSPIFKNNRDTKMTIMMPNTEAFENWIVANGGNSTDPDSLTTKEWASKWDAAFEYLFLKGTLNTTAVEDRTTVVFESFKKSPAGDWPLTMAFRKEAGYEAVGINDTVYNGTVVNALSGGVNVSVPDYPVGANIVAHVLSGWIVEPQSLSVTLAALNISSWPQISQRIASVAALETQRNFTLFAPAEAAVSAALALSDSELLAFVNAHLVQGKHVVLSDAAQTFTTVGGATIEASVLGVVSGSVNATVVSRDVFSNGGVVQLIDRSLVAASSVRERSEL